MPHFPFVKISTDGSGTKRGNPGGWAAVLRFGDRKREISGGEEDTTNNRMELTAAIMALEALRYECRVELTTDSEYLKIGAGLIARWHYMKWQGAKGPIQNRDLWERLEVQLKQHRVSWVHVKGHVKGGHADNRLCDELAGLERRKLLDAAKVIPIRTPA